MKSLIHFDGGLVLSLSCSCDVDWSQHEHYELAYKSYTFVLDSFHQVYGNILFKRRWVLYRDDEKFATLLVDLAGNNARLTLHYAAIGLRDRIDKKFIYRLLHVIGYTVFTERIRRADIAIDSDVNYSVVRQLIDSNRYATRLNRSKIRLYESSVTLGSMDNLEVCIYDKLIELSASKNPWRKLIDLQDAFGDVEHLTRVEFRLCRLWFNRNGIYTLDELQSRFYEIVKYLTRFIFCLQDDNHKSGYAFRLWSQMTAKHCQARVKRSSILIDRVCKKKDTNNLNLARIQLKSVLERGRKLQRSAFTANAVLAFFASFIREYKELADVVIQHRRSAGGDDCQSGRQYFNLFDYAMRAQPIFERS